MEPLQLAFTLVGLVALGHTITDYLRGVVNLGNPEARSAFISQSIAFVVFTGVVFLAASDSGLFGQIEVVGSETLNSLTIPAKVLVGFMLGGVGGVASKALSAFDNTDTAKVPPFMK